MAAPRAHLAHAPIAEALIDFRVQPPPDLTLERLQPLCNAVQTQFPHVTSLVQAMALLGPGTLQHNEQATGWLLRSDESAAAVQIRLDGFTFSKLPPYTSWNEVFGEASRLWRDYASAASPQAVTRLAVRYVNSLDIPAGGLAELLTAPPKLPDQVSAQMVGFLSRLVVEDKPREAAAFVTQALGGPPPIKLILDIDVFHARTSEPGADLTSTFEHLRQLKNEIFFACLTEEGIEPYL